MSEVKIDNVWVLKSPSCRRFICFHVVSDRGALRSDWTLERLHPLLSQFNTRERAEAVVTMWHDADTPLPFDTVAVQIAMVQDANGFRKACELPPAVGKSGRN